LFNTNDIEKNNTNLNASDHNSEFEKTKNKFKEIKKSVNEFLDVLINEKMNKSSNNENITNNINTLIITKTFSVEIISDNKNTKNKKRDLSASDDENEYEKLAIKNKLSIANFTECEEKLKSFYNISSNTPLIYKKVDFVSKSDLNRALDKKASNGVSFEFFNPENLQKLNSSICSQVKIHINIPYMQSENLNLSMNILNARINKNIDLFNPKSLGYHTRCIKSKDLETLADTSLSNRRNKLFQNESVSCSADCEYQEIDKNGYVKCDCSTTGQEEISNTGTEFIFDPIPSMNYDIFLCYYETFTDVKFFN